MAILVIVADKAKPEYVWLSIVPIILFYFSYYLGLERGFRDRYNEFVRKLHEERASLEDVFIVCLAAGFALTMRAARSMSVLPLYLLLAALLVLVRLAVLA